MQDDSDDEDDNTASDPTEDSVEGNNNNENKANSHASSIRPLSNQRKDDQTNTSLETSPGGAKAIKAKGTYYPLTAFPTSMPQGPVMRKGDESPTQNEPLSGRTSKSRSRLDCARFL